jgi:hypothetical protein
VPDLRLALHVTPGDTYEWSQVLLARAKANGTLELLTAAWENLLGYGRQELAGKTLQHFMQPGDATSVVASILDRDDMAPVDVTLRCRNGHGKTLRLHRRFDAYEGHMFIVAEELDKPPGR